MVRLRSISLRLTLWFSTVFLVGLVLFGLVMWFDLSYSLYSGRQRTLLRRADRMAELLETSMNASAIERAARFRQFEEGTPEGSLIQVYDSSNHRVYPTPVERAPLFPWPRLKESASPTWSQAWYENQPYLVLRRSVRIDFKPLTILVAGQLSDNYNLIHRFDVGLLATIPALFLLAAIGGYLLSRRALKPVDRLTVSARDFSVNNLSGRLPVAKTGDELQRLAETCNEMLSRLEGAITQMKRFTADASHELRSPISFIRTVAECARPDASANAECLRAFDDIIHETVQAGNLLEDMLVLARADSGEANLTLTPLDLGEIVQESVNRIDPLARAHRQNVSLKMQKENCQWILGEPDSLRRLLWILLDNAVKYTPDGGSITVEVENQNFHIKVLVCDTGIGISDAALPHIFDRFYRIDPSRSQVNGTGLGLAIAKWIADKHQAAITVTSREQHGTTFQIMFPTAS